MIKAIGTDIVEHERINLKIAPRVLTPREYEIFLTKKNKIQFLASRFAAKEAIIKAMDRQILMTEIELTNLESGKLVCNINNIHISIAHEKKYSVAFAIYEKGIDE